MSEYSENENMVENEIIEEVEAAAAVEAGELKADATEAVESIEANEAAEESEEVVAEAAEAAEEPQVEKPAEEKPAVPANEDLDDLLFDKVNRAARLLRNRKSALAEEAEAEAERTKDLVRALHLLELKPKMEEKEMADLLGMRLRALNELLIEAESRISWAVSSPRMATCAISWSSQARMPWRWPRRAATSARSSSRSFPLRVLASCFPCSTR